MATRWCCVLALLGCSTNALPPTGECAASASGVSPPVAEPIELVGGPASFDDLTWSSGIGRVMAAPQGTGRVYLVDPDSLAVTQIDSLPTGVTSVDEGGGRLFMADRGGDDILVVDPSSGETLSIFSLDSNPDYVRFSHATDEVWITEPGDDRIQVLSIGADGGLAHAAFIETPGGPEGLAFDVGRRRAFVHGSGDILAIDVDQRKQIDRWSTGCGGSHGIPQVDEARGFVFAGCSSAGGGAVLDSDDGHLIAGYEVGQGDAILGYSSSLGHFYLRGDPGTDVALLAVCHDGVSLLGTARVSNQGHGMVADDRGNAWVCDQEAGGLFRLRDEFPSAVD